MVSRNTTSRRRAAGSGSTGGGGSRLGPRGRNIFGRLLKRDFGKRGQRIEALSMAIASGKGGTGKSFVATSLAVLLAKRGVDVTLVDCDFGLACDHLLLGVQPKKTLRHLLSGEATLDDVRVETPTGVKLVPGASGVRQMADLTDRDLTVLARVLAEAAATSDVLLLDVGAGIAAQTVLTLASADHVLLVTQPEIAALTDAYALCKDLASIRECRDVHVVVNRVRTEGDGHQAIAKLKEVTRRFTGKDLGDLGEIAEDPMVTHRRLGQQPLVATDPESPAARSMAEFVERLEAMVGPFERRTVDAEQSIEERFRSTRLFL